MKAQALHRPDSKGPDFLLLLFLQPPTSHFPLCNTLLFNLQTADDFLDEFGPCSLPQ